MGVWGHRRHCGVMVLRSGASDGTCAGWPFTARLLGRPESPCQPKHRPGGMLCRSLARPGDGVAVPVWWHALPRLPCGAAAARFSKHLPVSISLLSCWHLSVIPCSPPPPAVQHRRHCMHPTPRARWHAPRGPHWHREASNSPVGSLANAAADTYQHALPSSGPADLAGAAARHRRALRCAQHRWMLASAACRRRVATKGRCKTSRQMSCVRCVQ